MAGHRFRGAAKVGKSMTNFDFDYRAGSVADQLAKGAPNGIDVYGDHLVALDLGQGQIPAGVELPGRADDLRGGTEEAAGQVLVAGQQAPAQSLVASPDAGRELVFVRVSDRRRGRDDELDESRRAPVTRSY